MEHTMEGSGIAPGPSHTTWLLIAGAGEPECVVLEGPGPYEGDTGLTIYLEHDTDEEPGLACEVCTVTFWPHVATALALAREHGAASLNPDGVWVAGEGEEEED